jgi:hypothetical protein
LCRYPDLKFGEETMRSAVIGVTLIATIIALANTAHTRESCQRLGNQTYCSDGKLYDHFGNTTYDRNGRSWEQTGSQVRGSDGRLYNQSGDQVYDSRGRPLTPFGHHTNEPSAGACDRMGGMVSCK